MFQFKAIVRLSYFHFSKKSKAKKTDLEPKFELTQAIKLAKEASKRNFDETLDIQMKLNVDPKHGDQMVRGTCIMPGGLGKKIKIAVLTSESQGLVAKEAGADFYDQKQIIQMIKDNQMQFDKLLSTPDTMPLLKAFARQLGPKGLMPNQKAGTLISNQGLAQNIKSAKSGQIEFRVDSGRNLMAPVGKVSFDDQRIIQNVSALALAVWEKKPNTIKGALVKDICIKTTMGKPIKIDFQTLIQRDEIE